MDEIRLGSRTLQPRRQLLVNGRREPIGKRALDILSVLALARGAIVTKDELLEAVWPGVTVEENALQVHIVALRKALGPEAERLKTIRGVGYQLDVDGPVESPTQPERVTSEEPGAPAAPKPAATSRPSAPGLPRFSGRRLAPIAGVLALLIAVAGAWWFAGASLGLRSQERVPVIVRQLSATGSDPTEAALASGITDELIVRLRRIEELRVARAGADDSLPGGSFEDANVVDGSIRRSGDRLRVTVRLTAANGEILWSQTFDRRFSDIFEVQERTAASIAEVLGVSLDVGDEATDYGGTDNPEAFAAYLEFAATQLNPDQSIPMSHLQRALALDPNYIKALAGVAVSHALRANFATTRAQAEATLRRADAVSQRAIDANPELWIGHMARAYYWVNRENFAAFDGSFRRVAALDKGLDSSLRGALAAWALNMGRTGEGLRLQRSMEAIEPAARRNSATVWALSNAGRNEEAIAVFDELSADGAVAVQQFAVNAFASYLALGREEDALRFGDRYAPGFAGDFRTFKAEAGTLSGMSDAELRAWSNRQFGEGGKGQLTNYASFASYLGDGELAVKLLRLAFDRPGGYTLYMLWNPVLSNARKTDAFERLMTDVGLAKIWRSTGDWPDVCRPVNATEFACR